MEYDMTSQGAIRALGDALWMVDSCRTVLCLFMTIKGRRSKMTDEEFANVCASMLENHGGGVLSRLDRVEMFLIHAQSHLLEIHATELISDNPRIGNTGVELTECDLSDLVSRCEDADDALPF